MSKHSKFDRLAKSLANRLTSEQYIALVQIVSPLTAEERAQFDRMSNDELLAELS